MARSIEGIHYGGWEPTEMWVDEMERLAKRLPSATAAAAKTLNEAIAALTMPDARSQGVADLCQLIDRLREEWDRTTSSRERADTGQRMYDALGMAASKLTECLKDAKTIAHLNQRLEVAAARESSLNHDIERLRAQCEELRLENELLRLPAGTGSW